LRNIKRKHKVGTIRKSNKTIITRSFVLKRKRNEDTVGKFQQKWEGPFLIIRTNKPGAFHLADMSGKETDHTFNIQDLRRYYP
jgi:hypothetical protein